MSTGWMCPECARVWATWVVGCNFCNAPIITSTTTNTAPPPAPATSLEEELRELLDARSLTDLCDWLDQHEEWPILAGKLRTLAGVLAKDAPPDHDADELTDDEVVENMALYEPSSKTLDALRDVAHIASAHCNGKADHMAIRHALAALQGHEPSLTAALDNLRDDTPRNPTPLTSTGEKL